ncbi:hypothetical protein QL285_012078 [Trifolium repens]|nr:hypothetical protein QL285_012078 [Trifolium repens]
MGEEHVDQGHSNQLLKFQLGIPNTRYAQATNNKINIMGKPNNPDQAGMNIINTPDIGVEKSIMPFKPFSFMDPSFQVWKRPNEKKRHYDQVDQGKNNQQFEHKFGIPNTCYAPATNNKVIIVGKPNPIQVESLLTHDVGIEKSIMPFKPFSFIAPSKLVRSARSSFQVWKKPNEKKKHYDQVDQGNNNQQFEHQFGIPNTCYAQATNNKVITIWKPIPIQVDTLLTHGVGVEKSIMPFKPFSFMGPSKIVRSASSSFQVWKKPNEKKRHYDQIDQENNNQQFEHQFGIPNTCYAQATNNKFITIWKPIPIQVDTLLTHDVGVEKSIMPFKPFSFMAPSKLVRSASSSFQVWKNPNEKKIHYDHVDQVNNNQQLEHQFGIPNTCYAQTTNNKIDFIWKPKPNHAEKTKINDSLLTPDVGIEKSILPSKPFSFMGSSKLVSSASSSFQVWKKPNEKKINYDQFDHRNKNQQFEHLFGISNTSYAQATSNKVIIIGKPNPIHVDSILTHDVGVEKSIISFKPFSFMAPSKLVRSARSSFQVWKKPNEKKRHCDQVDHQGNNNQQLEHQFGIPNTCCAQATNNKVITIWKLIPIQVDTLLTHDVGVEKSIMPFKPFSFMTPTKLVGSASSSFQVWKNPNEKKNHYNHVDQGNNNQQTEHQHGIFDTCYVQTTNNKNKIAEKSNLDQVEKTIIINDSLSTPDVGVSLIKTNQNCEAQTTKSSCLNSNLDINKKDKKMLKRYVINFI